MRNTGSIEILSLNVALSTIVAATILYISALYFVVIFLVLSAADELRLVVRTRQFWEDGKDKARLLRTIYSTLTLTPEYIVNQAETDV